MSGHSRYANIRHRKGAQDARRSRIFSRLSREITNAVTLGGSAEPTENAHLRTAIASARQQNMPGEGIQRAIRRASGVGGTRLIEGTFEGFGPGGVGIFMETATDNNNRTVMRIRTHLRRHGGTLGQHGCLQAIFRRLGVVTVRCSDPDTLSLALIDAGAEDLITASDLLTIRCLPAQLADVIARISAAGLTPESADIQRIPSLHQTLRPEQNATLQRLVDALESDEDVVAVYHSARQT